MPFKTYSPWKHKALREAWLDFKFAYRQAFYFLKMPQSHTEEADDVAAGEHPVEASHGDFEDPFLLEANHSINQETLFDISAEVPEVGVGEAAAAEEFQFTQKELLHRACLAAVSAQKTFVVAMKIVLFEVQVDRDESGKYQRWLTSHIGDLKKFNQRLLFYYEGRGYIPKDGENEVAVIQRDYQKFFQKTEEVVAGFSGNFADDFRTIKTSARKLSLHQEVRGQVSGRIFSQFLGRYDKDSDDGFVLGAFFSRIQSLIASLDLSNSLYLLDQIAGDSDETYLQIIQRYFSKSEDWYALEPVPGIAGRNIFYQNYWQSDQVLGKLKADISTSADKIKKEGESRKAEKETFKQAEAAQYKYYQANSIRKAIIIFQSYGPPFLRRVADDARDIAVGLLKLATSPIWFPWKLATSSDFRQGVSQGIKTFFQGIGSVFKGVLQLVRGEISRKKIKQSLIQARDGLLLYGYQHPLKVILYLALGAGIAAGTHFAAPVIFGGVGAAAAAGLTVAVRVGGHGVGAMTALQAVMQGNALEKYQKALDDAAKRADPEKPVRDEFWDAKVRDESWNADETVRDEAAQGTAGAAYAASTPLVPEERDAISMLSFDFETPDQQAGAGLLLDLDFGEEEGDAQEEDFRELLREYEKLNVDAGKVEQKVDALAEDARDLQRSRQARLAAWGRGIFGSRQAKAKNGDEQPLLGNGASAGK